MVSSQLRSWWSWTTQPWRSPGVALALVGSLALPALLLSSGPMFRTSASDSIATRVAEELEPGPAGYEVSALGALSADTYRPLDDALSARLDAIDALAPPVRTVISEEQPITAVNGVDPGGQRRDVRLFARPGALEAIDVLAGEVVAGSVVIPAALAEREGLEPGDVMRVGLGDLTVSGVYRDVWDLPADPYWQTLPRDDVPRFIRAFNEADFQLVIGDAATVLGTGAEGRARWEADLDRFPRSWDQLQRLVGAYDRVEAAFARETDVADAYRRFVTEPDEPPSVFTALDAARDDAATLIGRLQQPVRTATIGGTIAGLLLSTLGAVFLVRRRTSDFRLMAADGDAAWRFAARALVQYAAPAVAGLLVGVGAAWLTISVLGPSGGADIGAVPWRDVVAVTALACALAGVVTGAVAVRLTDSMGQQVGTIGRTWLFLLLGAVAAMWVQVGRDEQGGVNPLVVAFPLVGILAGVALVVTGLRSVLRSLRRTGGRLPTSLFLAWRALTASESGALMLTSAIGLASGLAMLSATFVDTIDAATVAKATTVVGSTSRVDSRNRVDVTALPPNSTVVLVTTTQAQDVTVDVVAIDPTTFADAVQWPSQFGGTPEGLVELLGVATESSIAAVLVEGEELPTTGEFGIRRTFPYEIVGSIGSVPLASTGHATLVIRADVLEQFALDRWAAGNEAIDPVDQLVAETLGQEIEYVSPIDAFGNSVVSRQPLDVLMAAVEAQGGRIAETTTLDDQVNSIGAQSTRWAFDYLGILAAIAGVVALAVMTFYLAERRAQRSVAAVMTSQMGVSDRTNMIAAIAEMVGLTVTAIAAGVLAATVTARRVFPVFEPDPDVPPAIDLVVSGITIATLLAIAIGAVSVLAGFAQRAASTVEKARVLRG